MTAHFHGPGCNHQPVGAPNGEDRLRRAADALSVALGADNRAGFEDAIAAARGEADELAHDLNPRTRAQARGLAAVLDLVDQGDEDEAVALLTGELFRAFTGRVDLSAAKPRSAAR